MGDSVIWPPLSPPGNLGLRWLWSEHWTSQNLPRTNFANLVLAKCQCLQQCRCFFSYRLAAGPGGAIAMLVGWWSDGWPDVPTLWYRSPLGHREEETQWPSGRTIMQTANSYNPAAAHQQSVDSRGLLQYRPIQWRLGAVLFVTHRGVKKHWDTVIFTDHPKNKLCCSPK